MQNDLLDIARKQAETSNPSTRAAALLRIARAESADATQARATLLHALNLIRNLPSPIRDHLFAEACTVAAAVSPDLLPTIPISPRDHNRRFTSAGIVQTMLAHGHVNAAFDHLLHYEDPASFPSISVGAVLHRIDNHTPESAERRLQLLRHALDMYRRDPPEPHFQGPGGFVMLFGRHWKEFPPDEALAITHAIIQRAAEEPDSPIQSGYPNEVHFNSAHQNTLFRILHVLRHLDPALAQSLIASHDQLAAAARIYPNGLETLHKNAEEAAARHKANGATCGGGYVFGGSPDDVQRQIKLFEATRRGDFEHSVQDALDKYHEDTAPETRNYAPKEYWPSTGAFRSTFHQAGKHLGPAATRLLDQIPDDDLRLFATIELAAALAGQPAPQINRMKQPRLVTPRRSLSSRILNALGITRLYRRIRYGRGRRNQSG